MGFWERAFQGEGAAGAKAREGAWWRMAGQCAAQSWRTRSREAQLREVRAGAGAQIVTGTVGNSDLNIYSNPGGVTEFQVEWWHSLA